MGSQISIFDGGNKFVIDKKIRLIELFGGIGSQAKALRNIGANFEHYFLCDIDKFAVKSYNAIHATNFTTTDIKKLHGNDLGISGHDEYIYLCTYSFPCTSISNAGLRQGMAKDTATSSALLWEVERLLRETDILPQVLLMENVPDVMGRHNIKDFRIWRDFLEGLGYKNYISFLNARHYGVPQNRNRCFMVSLLGDYYYDFPDRLPLKKRLRDVLEKDVDEKYYLSDNTIKYYRNRREKHNGGFAFRPKTESCIASTITTRAGSRPIDNYIMQAGNLNNSNYRQSNVVLSTQGICSTLTASEPPKIIDPDTAYGYYTNASDDYVLPPLKDLARTLKATMHDSGVVFQNRIRKLTPLECFRLMGFFDEDFYNCRAVDMSDTQLFKQAGNSIVVNVLEAIFKTMLPKTI